jgi:hypothetical protein
MNQDQIKQKLLELRKDVPEFTLIFSGKKSKKVDGLYKPETNEIIIHNKNHKTDNELLYTAIHEFAHHIQFFENPLQKTARSHNSFFWNIFHRLLMKAEELDIYVNFFKSDKEFVQLTKNIKDNYLSKHGNLMKEFGRLLLQAMELCRMKNLSFEDYLSRELLLNKNEVNNIIKISGTNIDTSVGFDNMKMLSRIKDENVKEQIEQAMIDRRFTPQMIKEEIRNEKKENKETDKLKLLMNEKTRIERTIQRLETNLKQIEEKIEKIGMMS